MTATRLSARVATVESTVPGSADLWCTYAALRALRWVGRAAPPEHVERTVEFLNDRRNADGGYAWSRGMSSDAWATFYCTQALSDLGRPPLQLDKTAAWLVSTWSGAGYGMMPGQAADVWATYFSTLSVVEMCGERVPDMVALAGWLRALQAENGGLAWSPEHAEAGTSDVRACYYGVAAWRAADPQGTSPPPWDVARLVAWLQGRQSPSGGFRFADDSEAECQWATYRAAGALSHLGARPTYDLTPWLVATRGPGGAFVRWRDYPVEDVWASFCAVGAMRVVGLPTDAVSAQVTANLAKMALPGGGYTYRSRQHAADALSVAAAAQVSGEREPGLESWLESCQLPNEAGIMYMPGRGAEVRCTLWGLAAGAFRNDPEARRRIAGWLRRLQNPDGGFGYWEGRGSDLVSTAAAVETAAKFLDGLVLECFDVARLLRFVVQCAHDSRHSTFPGGQPTARAGLQALRIRGTLEAWDSAQVATLLERHVVAGGGFADTGNRIPDLLTTYEAVVTADRCGLELDTTGLSALLARIHGESGTAWTPLGPPIGGALAEALATLLQRRLGDPSVSLPALTLS